MKQKLSGRDYTYVASMLFGMFFGAGNLIFPVHMGQMAGANVWPAVIGFCVTGVGLPLLGVAALGISRSGGLFELGSRVGKPYSMFFTCLLYLTIGPFFAIPRCATTSFTVGLEQVLPQGGNSRLCLLAFSAAFFAAALFFSLRPGKILVWVGKVLNPCFLLFLGILVIVAMLRPGAAVGAVVPEGAYASQPFFTGFLEGYNTMDALASLAFGIVVVQVIRDLGVTEPDAVAGSTVRAGIFSCLLMAAIYVAVTIVGVQSRGLFETSENGGIALAQIAQHYLGSVGLLILAATGGAGRDGGAGLSENLGGPHHQLRGDLHGPLPQGPHLPRLGGDLQSGFPALRQLRPELHHRLLRPRADVPLSPCHHADRALPFREILRL